MMATGPIANSYSGQEGAFLPTPNLQFPIAEQRVCGHTFEIAALVSKASGFVSDQGSLVVTSNGTTRAEYDKQNISRAQANCEAGRWEYSYGSGVT
jgi:hypothetical protein